MNKQHENEKNGHEKEYTIIVNSREKVVTEKFLQFIQIVLLAYPDGLSANMSATITYRRGHGNKPEASLTEGETVRIKEGMIFNVTRTNKS
jgi:hypothetical protein